MPDATAEYVGTFAARVVETLDALRDPWMAKAGLCWCWRGLDKPYSRRCLDTRVLYDEAKRIAGGG